MEFAALAPILVVLVLGAMSPGPSLAVLLRNTMEGGKARGVSCGVGHGIGFGIYAFVAIAGIAQLKASASEAATILELAGGFFLIILAAMMIKGSDEELEHKHSSKRGFTVSNVGMPSVMQTMTPLPRMDANASAASMIAAPANRG